MKKILTVFGLSAFFIWMTAIHHHWTLHTNIQTDKNDAVADTVGRDTEEPYISESSSTWGDLYRHFDPQGFEELSEEMQDQLKDIPLERTEENDGRPIEEFVSTQGYLYPEE